MGSGNHVEGERVRDMGATSAARLQPIVKYFVRQSQLRTPMPVHRFAELAARSSELEAMRWIEAVAEFDAR
jgi:hypothetical protein